MRTDIVIDTTNPVFYEAPEALHGVHVCIARDIDLGRKMDALVL